MASENILTEIWTIELPIVQAIFGFAIFDGLLLIRIWKKLYYIPMYFGFFPFNQLNKNLAIYLGEDYMEMTGIHWGAEKAEAFRKTIRVTAAISVFLTAVATPIIGGFLSSFMISPRAFLGTIFILVIFKAIGITKSLIGFKDHAIANKRNYAILIVVYLTYLVTTVHLASEVFEWSSVKITSKDWSGMAGDMVSFFIKDILVLGGILGLLTGFALDKFADPTVRKENLSKRFQIDE